jgi:hypothetical protein
LNESDKQQDNAVPVEESVSEPVTNELDVEEDKIVEDAHPIEIEFVLPETDTTPTEAKEAVLEEEIVIQLEDTSDHKQGTLFNLPGWMRGRR